MARAGNPVARSLGVQNACIAVKFEISRPARTSPRLKHATQKPTLLRQKNFSVDGSDIEAAPEPSNCHVHALQNLTDRRRSAGCAAPGVCCSAARGMGSRGVTDQPTAALCRDHSPVSVSAALPGAPGRRAVQRRHQGGRCHFFSPMWLSFALSSTLLLLFAIKSITGAFPDLGRPRS